MIYSTSARAREAARGGARRPAALAPCSSSAAGACSYRPAGGTIGRSRDCDIVLEDTGVSRRHAEIRPAGSGWTIEDLGSTNGVPVNGRTLHGAQPLQPGDRLELGSTEIIFEVG